MKFMHIEITDEQAKKLSVVIMKKENIWKLLHKIEDSNMKKLGNSYCVSAVYDDMLDRCIITSSKIEDLILKKRFDRMVKAYKSGKVHSPFGFGVDRFDALAHMMIRCPMSEC